jgi:hypothetical protein
MYKVNMLQITIYRQFPNNLSIKFLSFVMQIAGELFSLLF